MNYKTLRFPNMYRDKLMKFGKTPFYALLENIRITELHLYGGHRRN